MQMRGNTIFITGGGSGIGRALAEAFHRLGNKVIISGRRAERLQATIDANPGMFAVELDVTNPDSIKRVAADLIAKYPTLNVLINNAGVMLLDDVDGAVDERLFETDSMPPASKAIRPSADGFLYLDPSLFHADFAADLPADKADVMAHSQVYVSVKAATAPATSPAWKIKPSYAIVATMDRAINPELERSMYKRSNSRTTEVVSSHAVYISHPGAVAAVIEEAAEAGQ